jgi:hypothetical protein
VRRQVSAGITVGSIQYNEEQAQASACFLLSAISVTLVIANSAGEQTRQLHPGDRESRKIHLGSRGYHRIDPHMHRIIPRCQCDDAASCAAV